MTKNKLLRYQSQQLPLFELKNNRWHIPYVVKPVLKTKYLTTKEIVSQLNLESPLPLYRARREESAYWHNSEQIYCSRIVVSFGQRNKWLIFVPQISYFFNLLSTFVISTNALSIENRSENPS